MYISVEILYALFYLVIIFIKTSQLWEIINPRIVGHENVYFLTPHFEFLSREKVNDNELLKTIKIVLVHLIIMFQIVEKKSLKKFRKYKIHSTYD